MAFPAAHAARREEIGSCGRPRLPASLQHLLHTPGFTARHNAGGTCLLSPSLGNQFTPLPSRPLFAQVSYGSKVSGVLPLSNGGGGGGREKPHVHHVGQKGISIYRSSVLYLEKILSHGWWSVGGKDSPTANQPCSREHQRVLRARSTATETGHEHGGRPENPEGGGRGGGLP